MKDYTHIFDCRLCSFCTKGNCMNIYTCTDADKFVRTTTVLQLWKGGVTGVLTGRKLLRNEDVFLSSEPMTDEYFKEWVKPT